MECDDEVSGDNGFLLNSCFIPEEILVNILSYVDPHELVYRCRYVCKAWSDLITDNEVWKLMLVHSNRTSLLTIPTKQRMQMISNFPWYLNYWIATGVPFEQNLLQNNCGQEKLKHWKITEPPSVRGMRRTLYLGSGYWNVEPQPIYADPVPTCEDFAGNKCCFSTSYTRCAKRQQVDLWEYGFFGHLLDEFQPPIVVSEWYAGRYDCGCRYKLKTELMNDNRELIAPVQQVERQRAQWQGQEWNRVSLTFENYGFGLRYVVFEHEGIDTQFWAGNYGSKMSGAVVKVCLPKDVLNDQEN